MFTYDFVAIGAGGAGSFSIDSTGLLASTSYFGNYLTSFSFTQGTYTYDASNVQSHRLVVDATGRLLEIYLGSVCPPNSVSNNTCVLSQRPTVPSPPPPDAINMFLMGGPDGPLAGNHNTVWTMNGLIDVSFLTNWYDNGFGAITVTERVTSTTVPEPAAWQLALLAAGLGLGMRRKAVASS